MTYISNISRALACPSSADFKRYYASAALEAFIVAKAPRFIALPDAPSTLANLKAFAKAYPGFPLPVSSAFSDGTIYSTARINFAFRAWHDSLHLQLNAEFDADGELLVARAHEQAVRDAIKAGSHGLTELDCCALFFEVWGQFRYSQEHGGAFPIDQAAFIGACFSDGLSAAILRNY